jgi:hypothetical protein
MNVDFIKSMNGSANEEVIVDKLQSEATFGYKATIPLETLWAGAGDTPLITLRRDIEFMQMHPVVSAGMDYYCSGIAGAEFWGGPADPSNGQEADPNVDPNMAPPAPTEKPICKDSRVESFILAHCRAFWQRGLPNIQDGGYPYGWATGEHVYKEADGMLVWSHLRDVHPYDGSILTLNYQPVGVRIKNLRGRQPIDLWFASKSIPAKACWYAHRPRFGQFHGRSQLTGAWRPWRRLGWRDAVEQVIDAAIYRAGYKGPVVGHPPEDMQTSQSGVPGTRVDGQGGNRRSARDVARQMVEWAKAGAGFTKSTAKYPASMGGGDKWTIEFPEHAMDVRPLIEAAHYLEDQILLGMGIPPELIRAGGVGSGYAGRSIPREAFLDGQQKIANAILLMYVDQVVRPLVLWNFGDIPFHVECKSLLQTQSADKQGEGGISVNNGDKNFRRSQAAKDAWARRKISKGLPEQPQRQQMGPPKSSQASASQNPNPAFSLDPAMNKRVLEIVNRVMSRAY